MSQKIRHTITLLIGLCTLSGLSACGTVGKIKDIGQAPDLSPMDQHRVAQIDSSRARQAPAIPMAKTASNSLWRTGAKAFFSDHRAASIGDILTVEINIDDEAAVANSTIRSRSADEGANISNLLGLEGPLSTVLPGGFDPAAAANFGSSTSTSGTGTVDRSESVTMTLAAIVTGRLPNGNLLIQGRQEVRVNFEVREIVVTGVIRPEDISRFNTIKHTQIAEARISYGGRGQLTDLQQARWGQQLYEILFPF